VILLSYTNPLASHPRCCSSALALQQMMMLHDDSQGQTHLLVLKGTKLPLYLIAIGSEVSVR
jgi:hypothetical protein